MNKRSLNLFVLAPLLVFAAATFQTASAATLTFVYHDEKTNVDQNTLKKWQGQQTVQTSPLLQPQASPVLEKLKIFSGLPASSNTSEKTFSYKLEPVYELISSLAAGIDATTSEPQLVLENGKVKNFVPPVTGIKVDSYKTALETLNALANGETSVNITAYETWPKNSLADSNNLGIDELLAEGTSSFKGSPQNRRHNISVGVQKFQGLLIKKGEEFSFNENLGAVDEQSGFLPELVIKKDGTVPELGGGLCQVSSTLFRAAMAAGLPITERKNHAYAVSYYSPQGTDATIYPGSVDLKFINNTAGTILVWPYFKDKNTLVFALYGTKDSRKVTLEKPVVYDKKEDGSMKAYWTRIIIKDGQTATSTFRSIYQSPDLFHKTETFVTATGTPTTAESKT